MSKVTPTQKCLATLRADGYKVAVVEHWNPFAKIRQDLFHFIDIVAIKEGVIKLIQVTSQSNVSARKNKILSIPEAEILVNMPAVVIEVWGLKKYKKGKSINYSFSRYQMLPTSWNRDQIFLPTVEIEPERFVLL